MKLFLQILCYAFISSALWAANSTPVPTGAHEDRIRALEQAVLQLQEKVFQTKKKTEVTTVEENYTCFLHTTFNGTVMGIDPNEDLARAKVLEKCKKSGAGQECSKPIKCTK